MKYYLTTFILLILYFPCFSQKVNYVPFYNNKLWGLKDKNGNITIKCKYAEIEPFKENMAYFKEPDGDVGFMSYPTMQKKILPDILRCRSFSDGFAACQDKKNKKWGFLDKNLTISIKCKFDSVKNFNEGFAVVEQNGRYGYINTKGKCLIPCKYIVARNFSEGLAAVKKQFKYGFINKYEKTVIPFMYDDALNFVESLAPVKNDKKWGYINKSGKIVIEYLYNIANPFKNGFATVTNSQEQPGVINPIGKLIIPFGQFLYIGSFSGGIAPAAKLISNEIRYGYINISGKTIIPFKYTDAGNFSDGLALVKTKSEDTEKKEGKVTWILSYLTGGGYIDLKGNEYWDK